MNVVAIISEYNPFHKGHEHQINEIRKEFGKDTAIVAIMSGNYTQRAEVAFTDKFIRAKAAVLSGVDLVLELPFPYSMSSAEFFASAGVHIADSIGATHLSFGSESADIDLLTEVAVRMDSPEYKAQMTAAQKENKELGYPVLSEKVYNELYGGSLGVFLTPNNILGLEYIKAIKRQKSKLIPHTVKRVGASYSESSVVSGDIQSATAIRNLAMTDFSLIEKFLPTLSFEAYNEAYIKGMLPASLDALSGAILAFFRLNPPTRKTEFHDAKDGLYNRLHSNALDATSLSHLITLTDTKKFTNARIRRAILNSFLGVTSSDVKDLPEYTQVLGMNDIGKAILKNREKRTDFTVITKPSNTKGLSERAKKQKALSDKADSVFMLSLPTPTLGSTDIRSAPFILK